MKFIKENWPVFAWVAGGWLAVFLASRFLLSVSWLNSVIVANFGMCAVCLGGVIYYTLRIRRINKEIRRTKEEINAIIYRRRISEPIDVIEPKIKALEGEAAEEASK